MPGKGGDVPVEGSSWLAVRILGSSHANPILVLVRQQPIRASRECCSDVWPALINADRSEATLFAVFAGNHQRPTFAVLCHIGERHRHYLLHVGL